MIINNIIMINIKNLFITTGITLLFGGYSIYNILEYLRILNNYRVKQINSQQQHVNDINKKYDDLQIKYIELQTNYNELSIKYENINKELHILQIKVLELQKNKINETYIYCNDILSKSTPSIICDELCYFNSKIPRLHMETMGAINDINDINNINVNDIDTEFVESLNLEYNCNNRELSSVCETEKSSIKSKTRCTSITENNWGGLATKILFG